MGSTRAGPGGIAGDLQMLGVPHASSGRTATLNLAANVTVFLLLCGLPAQTAPCASELCVLIAQPREFGVELRDFYRDLQYQPVWSRDGRPSARAVELIGLLERAQDWSLRPADYRVVASLSSISLAQFDVALTEAVLRFLSDLHFGRADPGLYRTAKSKRVERSELPVMLRRWFLEAGDLSTSVEKVEPPFEGYRRALASLRRYRALAAEDDGEALPVPKKPVEAGGEYAGLARLTRLLRLTGDLPSGDAVFGRYSGALVEAVKRFQARHGLEQDGQIGRATLTQLNTPLRHRVRQLELTLERWRWVPHAFPRPPLVVNLPEFSLRAYDASYAVELEMKIIAGVAHRHSTPIFASELGYVVFRPFWNVPLSIQRHEIVPLLAKDPLHLSKHGYQVVGRDGTVVTADTTSTDIRAKLQTGSLLLRQVPGPNNALGLVKFIFPNRHGVYLHDTPARELFQRARRDFSHGCMRVERAHDLAAWVLREEAGWTPQRIGVAMNGVRSVRVDLKQPIPVLIVYGTAVALPGGKVHFLPDAYRYDAALDRTLAARHR